MLHRLFLALGLAAALGGCDAGGVVDNALGTALGDRYDYAGLTLSVAAAPAQPVAVAVIDHRPAVVNDGEGPSYVGKTLGRYRNKVDVTTESGRPLAAIVTEAVARALDARAPAAAGVVLEEGTPEAEALDALAATGAERLLLIRLHEWQTNATVRMTAAWHLEATVHDDAGGLLGRRLSRGSENIGTAGLEGQANALAVEFLARKLSQLIDDPAIAGPLGGA